MSTRSERRYIASQVNRLGREEVIHELLNFDGRVPLDFTPEFLAGHSVEQLKHILLAARLQTMTVVSENTK